MIRHALAEGWELLRSRLPVSLTLALALAVPLCLAGLTFTVSRWLEPLVAMGRQRAAVAVLLHPRMDAAQRARWVAEQLRRHPEWTVEAVEPEQLARRLSHWFPYLTDVLRTETAQLLPPLVEVLTADPDGVSVLVGSPSVIAVGPRSSVERLVGRSAERLGWALLAVAVVLLASAALLAAIWVHLELYRHADEIVIMRLLGATEGAIRGPFLVAVVAPGVLAAALAASATTVLTSILSRLAGAVGLPAVAAPWPVLAAQVALACGLPLAAATLTLGRHARHEAELD